MKTPKLSAAIIAFNEEKNIRDCLASVKWMDEIIVVDSFSTDNTVDICRQYTDKVIQQEWLGHVKQKQFALEQATGDWILSLDADERLSEEAAQAIKNRLYNGVPEASGFTFPRQSYYLGRWIKHCGWYPDRKLRLVRRGKGRWSGVDPHDKLVTDGKVEHLSGKIYHYVYHDISHQLKTSDTFSRIVAEQWHQEGKKAHLLSLLVRPPLKFFGTYLWKRGFLDGMPGLMISVVASYYVFLKYAKLWELQKIKK